MSARQFRPTTTLEQITRTFGVVEATPITNHEGRQFRPTEVEVVQLVDEVDVKAIVRGYVIDHNGDDTEERANAWWYAPGSGRSVAPELAERFPMTAAPRWVQDLVDEIEGSTT
jgi:hypothetical protein